MIEKNCKICKDLYDFREATPIYCRDAKFCVSTLEVSLRTEISQIFTNSTNMIVKFYDRKNL